MTAAAMLQESSMKKIVFLVLVLAAPFSYGGKEELQRECLNAASGMLTGASQREMAKYSNGKMITPAKGAVGVPWFYPNGKLLTAKMGVPGQAWFYPNGKTVSSSFGTAGSQLMYDDGRVMSNNGPELSLSQMIDEACKLIMYTYSY